MKVIMEEKVFRTGAIGALMDEHERALAELLELSETYSQEQFVRVVDIETKDDDCRSVQTILNHVVRAGYGYSNYIRDKFNIPKTSEPGKIQNIEDISENNTAQLKMFDYMLESVKDLYELSEKELGSHIINTRWGATIDIDMLLEHAVMHLLRHRRQLEKFNLNYFY